MNNGVGLSTLVFLIVIFSGVEIQSKKAAVSPKESFGQSLMQNPSINSKPD